MGGGERLKLIHMPILNRPSLSDMLVPSSILRFFLFLFRFVHLRDQLICRVWVVSHLRFLDSFSGGSCYPLQLVFLWMVRLR